MNRFPAVLLLAGALLLCGPGAHAQTRSRPPSVVIINSYHPGFLWSDQELQGLLSRLRETYPAIDPPVEFLDAKRFSSAVHIRMMKDYLVRKYAGSPVDLVVALDNPALDMLLQYRSELFPGTPIVFAGVSGFSSSRIPPGMHVTGVAEISDIAGTLRLALRLRPQTREVLLVNDSTVSGRVVQREAEDAEAAFRDTVRFSSLPPCPIDEAARRIRALPSDAIVLLLSYATDGSGRAYSLEESTRILAADSPVPVFGVHVTRLGYGIVGGSLLRGLEHGRKAAEIALRVLAGEDASRIPIDESGTSLPMFDDRQLERFRVPMWLLPRGSIVINTPQTVFTMYPAFSVITTGAVAALIALVVLLTLANLRRRKAESRLLRSEANLTALIESTDDLIASSDLEGRLLVFNPAFERTVRELTATAVRPGMLAQECLPDSLRASLAALQAEALNGRPGRREITWPTSGVDRVFEVTLHPIRAHGNVIGVTEFIRDITDRKRAEKALRDSEEKLIQSHKLEAVGRLAGGIAHDFNNLLTVITGYADLALEKVGPGGEVLEEMREMRAAAAKAAKLTAQMLAFSRRQVLQPRVFNPNGLIGDMTKMLRRVIGEDIELSVRLPEHIGNVRADPAQIEQVLLNIVINARDAMPEGGMLRVQTRAAVRDAVTGPAEIPPGPYVLLSVADTGTGMDPETLSHIFEPFFTTKEEGKGTGLGLSTAYGIVKQSGGWIYCASIPGIGTTFTIWLPQIQELAEESRAAVMHAAPAGGKETVMLVEDDASVRRFLGSVLASAGYDLREAANGAEALVALRSRAAALVITDMVMPLMGGRELVTRVRQSFPETRLLVISGYLSDPAPSSWILDGKLRLLQKPFGPRELLAAVREVLDTPG
jgi:two-component system cell cycle sensor histidine kinase/response regulator CckA